MIKLTITGQSREQFQIKWMSNFILSGWHLWIFLEHCPRHLSDKSQPCKRCCLFWSVIGNSECFLTYFWVLSSLFATLSLSILQECLDEPSFEWHASRTFWTTCFAVSSVSFSCALTVLSNCSQISKLDKYKRDNHGFEVCSRSGDVIALSGHCIPEMAWCVDTSIRVNSVGRSPMIWYLNESLYQSNNNCSMPTGTEWQSQPEVPVFEW